MNDTPNTATPDTTVTPAPVAIEWEDFAGTCQSLDHGMFVATVQADGRPHLAWVSPGWHDGRIWFSTFAHSQKAVNLRHSGDVALHWPQRPDAIALCRGNARLVDDRAESDRLWDSGILPYDLGMFFSSKDDPELLFVEITPTSASISSLDPSMPKRRWKPAA